MESMKSLNMHVRLNGKYYGKFAFGEQLDKDSLKVGGWAGGRSSPSPLGDCGWLLCYALRFSVPPTTWTAAWMTLTVYRFFSGLVPALQGWGYNVNNVGPLWKSTSGEFSNLRWDVPPEHIQYYWKKVCGEGWGACFADVH